MKHPKWLILFIVAIIVLATPQCRRDKAQEPKPGSQPAVTAIPEDAGKTAREQAAKASVFDINALLEARDPQAALRLATASLGQYADTAAAGELQRLKQKAEEAVRAAEKPAPGPAKPPEGKKAEPAGQKRFAAFRDAGIAAMNAGDYAGAVASFEAALKERDDAAVRALLQRSVEMSGPPALAVAEFEVGEDVGISGAGALVADALLRQFDPQRFRLVDRASLSLLLEGKSLAMAQVVEDPSILRDREIAAVRYLVVGRISRIGDFLVTARMIDVGTGEVIQTGEVLAADENELISALPGLVAMLQMTDQEKTEYENLREQGLLGAADTSRLTAAETSFAARQHARDAMSAVTEIRMFMARGDLVRAREYAAWAAREFGDTGSAREIDDLRVFIEGAIGDRREEELRRIHERFLRLRDRGRVETANGNIDEAIRAYEEALRLEDDPAVRQQLQWLRLPGLAVADFDVSGNVGLANPGRTLAGYVLERMAGDGRKYRAVERPQLDNELRRLGLSHKDAVRNPADILLRRMRGVRYLVLGTAKQGSIELAAGFYDLQERRLVQTAEVTVRRSRELQRGLEDLSKMLQMSDDKRRIYVDQLRAKGQMEIGDEAAASKRWADASAAYQEAYRLTGERKALDKKKNADRMLAGPDGFAKAMAEGSTARDAKNWEAALAAYQRAAGLGRTPAEIAEIGQAKKALYDAVLAEGRAAEQASDWRRALGAYEMALKITSSVEARNAVTRAKAKLEPVKPEPAKPEPVIDPVKPVEPKEPKQPTPFEQALAKGNAARDAGSWAEALAAYEEAGKLDRTTAAVSEVGKARRSLYDAVMGEGRTAEQAGDWPRALGAYEMALKVTSSVEARNAVTRVKAKLEPVKPEPVMNPIKPMEPKEQPEPKEPKAPKPSDQEMTGGRAAQQRLYESAMSAAAASGQAGDWPKALAAYEMAARINNTPEAQSGIAAAKEKTPRQPTPFERALAEGNVAMAAQDWPQAQTAYATAMEVSPDGTARAEVGKLRRALYNAVMAEGRAAEQAGEWAKAVRAYEIAFKTLPSAEARIALDRAKKKGSARRP
jgi:tetratricopeptide (TPR) repeat protein